MKKLTAFAAALAGLAASAAVESSNIVGYMQKDMATAGYYNYMPMFVGVGGTAPAIKDIVPSSDEVSDLSGGVIQLYVLNTNRKFLKTFAWFTEEDFYDQDGWYLGTEEEVTDYTLNPGESLQMQTNYKVTLTYAGQVDLGAYTFTAPAAGYYMTGNQHAKPMAIKDIGLSSDVVADLSGGVTQLYVLDTTRKFAKTFAWFTEDDFYDQDGWYLGTEEEITDYVLQPGEALQMQTNYKVTLSFPAQEINE